MSWQLLVGISVITYSISVILRRLLLFRDKSDPIAYAIVFQGVVGIFTGLYALINGLDLSGLGSYWFAVVLTCILYALGNITSAKALQAVEASVYSVLFASSAIWTVIAGTLILHDSLGLAQVFGIVFVLLSVIILVENKSSLKFSRGLILALVTAGLLGLATVGWTYVARRTDVPTWTSVSFLAPALVTLVFQPRSVLKIKPFLKKRVLLTMLVLGLIFSVSSLTALFAYRKGNVNSVVALQQTAIVLTTVLGVIFLNERDKLGKKLAAATVCLIGVLFIVK